ncbi:Protein phosphatase PP2A regulatory subunit B [Giardia lamblia P15]|uniref:Serine/threonine-protein phosphatase 2A 55 kDa regulatory subunit B n=1 Tax=Giardia intestinalis (strain P15) TaxID=658858 RepID=E1EXC9_GIAIA|nr:Protein phosphatase PP2A regulatory subunit B [Giardia lamblia P15]
MRYDYAAFKIISSNKMSHTPYLLDHLDYRYCQVFGDCCDPLSIPRTDYISSLAFSSSGDHIAVGDCGGRIVIFRCVNPGAPPKRTRTGTLHPSIEYDFMLEFQSHVAEYDYMRSLDVQARITSINFLTPLSQHMYFLSANDKDIKLWRIRDTVGTASLGSDTYIWGGFNKDKDITSVDDLVFPTKVPKTHLAHPSILANGSSSSPVSEGILERPPTRYLDHHVEEEPVSRTSKSTKPVLGLETGTGAHADDPFLDRYPDNIATGPTESVTSTVSIAVRKNFTHASNYHINSVCMGPGSEQFISSDDLTITQWWVEDNTVAHMLVDLRPHNLSDIVETICSADLDPTTSSLITFGTNYGKVKSIDPRMNAICDASSLVMTKPNPLQIESVKFISPTTIAARDLLDLCIYDIRNPSQPLSIYAINVNFPSELVQSLYCDPLTLYDSFNMAIDRKGQFIATGSYNSSIQIYNLHGTAMSFKVTRDATKTKETEGQVSWILCSRAAPIE